MQKKISKNDKKNYKNLDKVENKKILNYFDHWIAKFFVCFYAACRIIAALVFIILNWTSFKFDEFKCFQNKKIDNSCLKDLKMEECE